MTRRQALTLLGVFAVMAVPYFLVARAFRSEPPARAVAVEVPAPALPPLDCGSVGLGTDGAGAGVHDTPERALHALLAEASLEVQGEWVRVGVRGDLVWFTLQREKAVAGHALVARADGGWTGTNVEVCEGAAGFEPAGSKPRSAPGIVAPPTPVR